MTDLDLQGGWADVGALVRQVLVRLDSDAAAVARDGLSLAYVPFSDLGSQAGVDLRWEVNLLRAGVVAYYANDYCHPALVLRVLLDEASLWADQGQPVPVTAPAPEAPADWRELGPLLRQAADLSHQLPPEDALVELTGTWALGLGGPWWAWCFEVVRGDVLDDPDPVLQYRALCPVVALREALDDAPAWTPPRPR